MLISIINIVKSAVIILGSECPLTIIPKNSTMYENNHFLLSKVKEHVKARFIGKPIKNDRKKLLKQIWVLKALITHVEGTKLG
jgi:hypothetical protein